MLAVVRAPHTRAEISLTGKGVDDILEFLRSRFSVKVLANVRESEPTDHPRDDELVNLEKTDYWKERAVNRNGHLLAGCRLRANQTQAELAAELDIPQSHLSRMESGKMAITPDMAKRIGEILGVDLPAKLDFASRMDGKSRRCARRRKTTAHTNLISGQDER